MIAAELHYGVASMNARPTCKEITPQSTENYCRAVVKPVFFEEAHDNQRKKSRTGLIKISSLSNNGPKQSDPGIAFIMFHKIANMYRDITKQETVQALLLI